MTGSNFTAEARKEQQQQPRIKQNIMKAESSQLLFCLFSINPTESLPASSCLP